MSRLFVWMVYVQCSQLAVRSVNSNIDRNFLDFEHNVFFNSDKFNIHEQNINKSQGLTDDGLDTGMARNPYKT
jgi:hypothetical protein